jgi:hypothetical protein
VVKTAVGASQQQVEDALRPHLITPGTGETLLLASQEHCWDMLLVMWAYMLLAASRSCNSMTLQHGVV